MLAGFFTHMLVVPVVQVCLNCGRNSHGDITCDTGLVYFDLPPDDPLDCYSAGSSAGTLRRNDGKFLTIDPCNQASGDCLVQGLSIELIDSSCIPSVDRGKNVIKALVAILTVWIGAALCRLRAILKSDTEDLQPYVKFLKSNAGDLQPYVKTLWSNTLLALSNIPFLLRKAMQSEAGYQNPARDHAPASSNDDTKKEE